MKVNNEAECLTITVEEAGKRLGISRPTAYKMANEGQIPTIRLGRRWLVPKVQFEKMLAGVETRQLED